MDALGRYMISITSCAMICSVIGSFIQNSSQKILIQMLCGMFLTITALSPILRTDFQFLSVYPADWASEGERITANGEKMVRDATAAIIKQQTEAYILDKAAEMHSTISVEVNLNPHNIPAEAVISGQISPYARLRLQEILESDLGITKENQIWTG